MHLNSSLSIETGVVVIAIIITVVFRILINSKVKRMGGVQNPETIIEKMLLCDGTMIALVIFLIIQYKMKLSLGINVATIVIIMSTSFTFFKKI